MYDMTNQPLEQYNSITVFTSQASSFELQTTQHRGKTRNSTTGAQVASVIHASPNSKGTFQSVVAANTHSLSRSLSDDLTSLQPIHLIETAVPTEHRASGVGIHESRVRRPPRQKRISNPLVV